MSMHHLPPEYHQIAPFPNMETSCATPAKRGPEDDVQFVAAQPVKKYRNGREQPPATSFHPQNSVLPETQAATGQPLTFPVSVASNPPPERYTRTASLPTMDNFAFPSSNTEIPSHTSQSSPILSPRQVPPSMIPSQTHTSTEATLTGSTASAGVYGLEGQKEMTMPWNMSYLPPHPMPQDQNISSIHPAGFTPFQPTNSEQHPVLGAQENPSKSPDVTRSLQSSCIQDDEIGHQRLATSMGQDPAVANEDPGNEPQQPKSPQVPSQQTQRHAALMSMPCPSVPGVHLSVESPNPAIKDAGSEFQPQQALDDGNVGFPNTQPPAPRPPCLACEQSRQHAIYNHGNTHWAGHHPQLQHPWHVPGTAQPQQMHMGRQSTASTGTNFHMAASTSQNLQPRTNPGPMSHGPVSYVFPAQLQSQIPMTLARQMTASAGISGPDSLQNILLHNQGQHVLPGQVSHVSSTYPSYLQSQLHAFQQPLVLPRSFLNPSVVTPIQPSVATPQPRSSTSNTRASTPAESREHSPNLIIDIAETCEDLFPWEEVAQRHNVSRQKVVETFSAVVQLPLLRCTTDKRRHGNLATSRLRQYTKAKRDVEAAKASSNSSPSSPTDVPATSENRAILPVVWEMASTMTPLGLPSSITNGLAGGWQR